MKDGMRRSNMMDYSNVPKKPAHELLADFIVECMSNISNISEIEAREASDHYKRALANYRIQVEGYCQLLRLMTMAKAEHAAQVADRLQVHQDMGHWNNTFDITQIVIELRQYADALEAEAAGKGTDHHIDYPEDWAI